jgi:UDP-N-acetylglucosamine acyltransferase
MATVIHPTAIVDKRSSLGADVKVGPFAIVEADAVVGDRCEIGPHVSICGGTRMGAECRVFNGSNIGGMPQDLKFGGERTLLRIGDNCTIRECCTLNRGTKATGETVIGSNCLFMAYCHVAHDCRIGDYLISANSVHIAGHVEIGHHVNIGGVTGITQFRKIGDYVHIGAGSIIIKDILHFAMVASDPMRLVGINRIGLMRAGFSEERRRIIKRVYKVLFRDTIAIGEACARLSADYTDNADVEAMMSFIKRSTRGLLRMRERMVQEDSDE